MTRYVGILVKVCTATLMATTGVQASAKIYKFTATGVLGNPYSVDRNFNVIPTPQASIAAGDAFSINFTIHPQLYGVTSFCDVDPFMNIYWGTVTDYKIQIGAYKNSYKLGALPFSSLQLWDGYISGGSPVDAFVISTLFSLPSGKSPVAHGSGLT